MRRGIPCLLVLMLAARVAFAQAPADEVARGTGLFQTRCADCHGIDAKGVHGPDLTVVFANGATDDRVFQTIRRGVAGTEMPASNAPDAEIRAIGPDLSRVGLSRSRALLTRDIRDASAIIAPGYQAVTLVLGSGQRIRGARKNEDAFSVQIMLTTERLQGYRKSDLREVV